MQVLKFGGTSVANAENIQKVIKIVSNALESDRTVVVSSAISGCTDKLIEIGHTAAAKNSEYLKMIEGLYAQHIEIIDTLLQGSRRDEAIEKINSEFNSLKDIVRGVALLGELSPASLDAIQGFGELLSTSIITIKFISLGITAKWLDSREIIKTKWENGANVVDTILTYQNIEKAVESYPQCQLFIVPGFIASDAVGRSTTLGRGGSDYTASLWAVGCKARVLEIWTDVPGIMTSNPKIVPTARTIPHISYRAALELSHFGAKVVYPPTIQPVIAEGIPIYVKDTFHPEEYGTLIEKNPPRSKDKVIGISNSDNIALISLEGSGMVGIPGFSSRLFETLSRHDINIILITQASSVHTMCIAIAQKDAQKAKEAADKCFAYEISLGKLDPLKVETGYSIVCLVGDDILNQIGATGRMFAALGKHSIAIRATAQGSSERNISVIVPSKYVNPAIRYIHNEFFDKTTTTDIPLFIAGYGVVGKALVEMIKENREKIQSRSGKKLKVVAIANSKKYLWNLSGIDLDNIPQQLSENGEINTEGEFFEKMYSVNIENSIFVDCTASGEIPLRYEQLMKCKYSIVACNKIGFSLPYSHYRTIKETAASHCVSLRHETTVGAALPILETIQRSVNSADEIISMEGILSGTLNYIFSTYKGGGVDENGEKNPTFEEVVLKAKELGYTEPDPFIDLSGVDVLRKLLIASREALIPLEEEDIVKSELLPQKDLQSCEEYFAKRYKENQAEGKVDRYVARLVKDPTSPKGYRGEIGLMALPKEHPFSSLQGSDNAFILKSEYYPESQIIKGAGAGAKQTASGLLHDILLTNHH